MIAVVALWAALAPAEVATSSAAAAAPRIELITLGPGGYLYSYWGHTALRVFDPRDGSDSAYNFGAVDFGEGALSRMLRGYVEAFVVRTSFAELLASYSGEDRTIRRRILAL